MTRVEDARHASWRWQLSQSRTLGACGGFAGDLSEAESRQPFVATPYYLSIADLSDPEDPILKQCLPDVRELVCTEDECDDPFGEEESAPEGMVHRFADRVLVVAANVCATNCRHCTRRNVLRGAATVWDSGLPRMQEYLRAHPMVREVLISGGDPLMLEEQRLRELLEAVCAVETVEVVRIGTRVPVVLPMRVDEGLCAMLREFAPLWVNTQFNHPRELTGEAAHACGLLVDAGIPVSNQSVLLRGVNDDVETMVALCAGLQRLRVRPYYVFVCDPVAGTSHFRVGVEEARSIAEAVETRLGGLAVPRFVADVPGAPFKVGLDSRRFAL